MFNDTKAVELFLIKNGHWFYIACIAIMILTVASLVFIYLQRDESVDTDNNEAFPYIVVVVMCMVTQLIPIPIFAFLKMYFVLPYWIPLAFTITLCTFYILLYLSHFPHKKERWCKHD